MEIKEELFFQSECQYKLSLFDTDRNKIADMDIILKLEDCGPHCILKKETVGRYILYPLKFFYYNSYFI